MYIFLFKGFFFLFQVLAPLHVRSVERPSNTSITWRSTGDYTPGRSRSSARNVASASVTQGRTASTWTTATSTVNRSERTASAPPKARGPVTFNWTTNCYLLYSSETSLLWTMMPFLWNENLIWFLHCHWAIFSVRNFTMKFIIFCFMVIQIPCGICYWFFE